MIKLSNYYWLLHNIDNINVITITYTIYIIYSNINAYYIKPYNTILKPYHIPNHTIPYRMRDLGVIFDQFLSFDDYISSVCRSTHFHLRNIGRIRHLLSHHATAQLIHALISTRLDYCNSVLYNLPRSSILRLQKIQNQAARILTRRIVVIISQRFLLICIG